MRPRGSVLTGGFDLSGCGDCTSCPPFEQTEMSHRALSALVLQRILCMWGLYSFRFSNADWALISYNSDDADHRNSESSTPDLHAVGLDRGSSSDRLRRTVVL